ncbi:MAG: transposase [candidate division KSB1 bacterium]|nr:transposase [candidate division KSB1 bacterium]MDZ7367885.1 transposase [candidate division KSB1 bacterium]MDZ7407512.1 transposase [candidate division KSB1 bacterium]
MFSTEHACRDTIKKNFFYRFLSHRRAEIFRDQDYTALYCSNNGRTSVPPSVLTAACVLQNYDRLSDAETVARATYDVRRAVALGTELGEQPLCPPQGLSQEQGNESGDGHHPRKCRSAGFQPACRQDVCATFSS